MSRVIVAEGCREMDIGGTRHYAGDGSRKSYLQGGVFRDLSAAAAQAVVRIGGAIASEAGVTSRTIGYRCPACGFGSFTRRCGRCGQECEREQ